MTLASDISTTSTALSDIKQAIIAKGVTPTGNITTYATAISQIGGASGKYKIGDRVYDSGNNDIGMVFGFYTDANDVEYAVVCLNAEHRLNQGKWADSTGSITNMPLYNSINTAAFGIGTDTATANCDLILASKTSNSVTHCRSKSFVIDGTTYKGQLPNICETLAMFAMHSYIEAHDPTASSAGTNLNFTSWKNTWSSSQYASSNGWYVGSSGSASSSLKTNNCLVAPGLEIPSRAKS